MTMQPMVLDSIFILAIIFHNNEKNPLFHAFSVSPYQCDKPSPPFHKYEKIYGEMNYFLIVNKSLMIRGELYSSVNSLMRSLKRRDIKRPEILSKIAEISNILSRCYECHHREEILSTISSVKGSVEKILKMDGLSELPEIAASLHAFSSYAFSKAQLLSYGTYSRIVSTIELIKYNVLIIIGSSILLIGLFTSYSIKKINSLEKDIKQKEKLITDWADNWQNTFDTMEDMIVITDLTCKPVQFNSSASRFFGESILREDFCSLIGIEKCAESSQMLKLKGRYLNLKIFRFRDKENRCILVFRDLTKEKELEDRLRISEKLSAIGTMAGAIAHEINNPLTAVVGYIALLLNMENDELKKEHLREAMDSAKRIEKIVKDILAFARTSEIKQETVNFENLIDNILKSPSLKCSKRVRIIKKLGGVGNITLDMRLIESVVTNIINNAIEAIEGSNKGDTIEIRTWRENTFINISISDNGPGIPSDILPRIFDPFFTTKEVGKGTGLGLSIAHNMVRAHDGEITVKSKEGEGTTFIISIKERRKDVEHP